MKYPEKTKQFLDGHSPKYIHQKTVRFCYIVSLTCIDKNKIKSR